MYAIAQNMAESFDNMPGFFNSVTSRELQQEYSNARSNSKRKQSVSKRNSNTSPKKGKRTPLPVKKQNRQINVAGLDKRYHAKTLLDGDVREIAALWPIPSDALWDKSLPFDGDHMFTGKWDGYKNLLQRGSPVVIKSFSGTLELKEYCVEVTMLNEIKEVPYTQRLTLAKQCDGIDFAVIVTPSQIGTIDAISDVENIRVMGRQILEALVWLDKLRIFHRDIKPANILWSHRAQQATLIDFGLATKGKEVNTSPISIKKFAQHRATVVSCGNVGTEGYHAPEVLSSIQYSSKIDVYSFGITLRNLARASKINDDALESAVCKMTKHDSFDCCTAAEALRFPFFFSVHFEVKAAPGAVHVDVISLPPK